MEILMGSRNPRGKEIGAAMSKHLEHPSNGLSRRRAPDGESTETNVARRRVGDSDFS